VKRIIYVAILPLALGIALGISLRASGERNEQPRHAAAPPPLAPTGGAASAPAVAVRGVPNLDGYKIIARRLGNDFNILLPIRQPGGRVTIVLNMPKDGDREALHEMCRKTAAGASNLQAVATLNGSPGLVLDYRTRDELARLGEACTALVNGCKDWEVKPTASVNFAPVIVSEAELKRFTELAGRITADVTGARTVSDPQAAIRCNCSLGDKDMAADLVAFVLKLGNLFKEGLPEVREQASASVAINIRNTENLYLINVAAALTVTKVENGIAIPLASAAMPANLPASYDVVIRRRPRELAVVVDDIVCAEVSDSSFRGGVAKLDAGTGISDKVRVQHVGEIFFADDFMKGNAGSQWSVQSGAWHVNTLDNSGLSSNAFFYTGRADAAEAVSVGGYWFWDSYVFEAACKGEGSEDIGLAFCYRGPNDFYLFRWNFDAPRGRKQLVKVRDGNAQVMAEAPGGFTVNQWYRMEVRVARRRIEALIDGNRIFSVADNNLAYGRVGLYNAGVNAARFDDVFVRSHKSVVDDFSADTLGAWQQLGGSWRVERTDGTPMLRASLKGHGKAVTGDDTWRNYTVTATVAGLQQGSAGLAARYRDEAHHYLYTVASNGTHELVKVRHGVRTVLASRNVPLDAGRKHKLFLTADETILSAGADGVRYFEEWDADIPTGRAGLFAQQAGSIDFENAAVGIIAPRDPVLTTNEVFEAEKTMANWASKLSDWHDTLEQVDDRSYRVAWHRADFYGDAEVCAKLLPTVSSTIYLALGADGRRLASGYGLAISNDGGLALELFRKGQSMEKQTVKADQPIRVSLKRKGSFVIAMVNFEPVIRFKDHGPLSGCTVGYGQTAQVVEKEDVEVFCDNVQVYTFDQAGTDWRVAAGTWEVSSRWQCDPRWSFFSGVSKSDAIIWNKRLLNGDVTLEFAAGIKMDRERGGKYEYASDINATICADGKDLTSGYSFMFGGWGNSCTRIMRGGKVLAENKTEIIPNQEDIHRRWFFIKICKQGPKLFYYVDNKLVLEVEDPKPLAGNRVALWTHNNGVMVAKVRMSCIDGERRESPDFKPRETPESPYTFEAKAKEAARDIEAEEAARKAEAAELAAREADLKKAREEQLLKMQAAQEEAEKKKAADSRP